MFNIRFGVAYLRHRLKAINRHGLHSPFVYRLVDKVIYDYSAKKVYPEIEAARKRLANDSKLPLSPKLLKLIYRIMADWQPKTVIDAGNKLSLATQSLQQVMPDVQFYSAGPNQSIENLQSPNLIYFSGEQSQQDFNSIFENNLSNVTEGSLMIFENIYRTAESGQTWADVKAHPRVSITVDLFWIGLVYFREGKVKEDFFIKF